jgi:hypothetical protein
MPRGGARRSRPGPVGARPRRGEGSDWSGAALRWLAAIGSPVALGTALLFYFGFVRARTQASALGFDSSIMDLTPADYVLKSVDALYIPVLVLAGLALMGNVVHERLIVPWANRWSSRATAQGLARVLSRSWVGWLLLGAALLLVPPVRAYSLPLGITGALLCVLYGRALAQRVAGVEPLSLTRRALIFLLIAFVAFWDTERLARSFGEGYAGLVVAQPQRLSAVTLFSAKSLRISAPGVTETPLRGSNLQYRYRYDGLRLLQQSGERYFLINKGWDRRTGRVVVLRDSGDLRMEYSRPP